LLAMKVMTPLRPYSAGHASPAQAQRNCSNQLGREQRRRQRVRKCSAMCDRVSVVGLRSRTFRQTCIAEPQLAAVAFQGSTNRRTLGDSRLRSCSINSSRLRFDGGLARGIGSILWEAEQREYRVRKPRIIDQGLEGGGRLHGSFRLLAGTVGPAGGPAPTTYRKSG
jgi:hypothetical protein